MLAYAFHEGQIHGVFYVSGIYFIVPILFEFRTQNVHFQIETIFKDICRNQQCYLVFFSFLFSPLISAFGTLALLN